MRIKIDPDQHDRKNENRFSINLPLNRLGGSLNNKT